jgi:predicted transcriptional regulator
MADTDESQSDGDAAQAFEHLTQEVNVLHHTVEELVDAIHLKEPPDYSSTLGEIAQDLGSIRERLDQIERHPALRIAPAQFGEAVAQAGRGAMREAANQLDQARRDSERTVRALAHIIGSARTQDRQLQWVMIAAAIALVVGLGMSPSLARLLPFGIDGRIAATIMGADRWNAGAALMQAQSPQAWRALMDAGKLFSDNSMALAACREAAAKAKKEQRCTLVVPAT